MITIIASIIFIFCCWAVFSKHFCDGIITKHFLAIAAIAASLAVLDPYNPGVAIWAAVFLGAGMTYWTFRNYRKVRNQLRKMCQ